MLEICLPYIAGMVRNVKINLSTRPKFWILNLFDEMVHLDNTSN